VVYNDALAERRRAYLAGERLSDREVQRRVVTLAKTRPERAWLAEIASGVLMQACQDARRAYRSWFDAVRQAAGPAGQHPSSGPSTAAIRSG
jgi:putative transposase